MGLFDAFSGDDEAGQFRQGNKKYNRFAGRADDYISEGYGEGRDDIREGRRGALDALNQGVGQAAGYYQQGITPFEDLFNLGKGGIEKYYGLLENPDGIYDSELYKTREQAGIDQLNRMANSRGMLASGNNTQDQLDYMKQSGLDYFNTLLSGYRPSFDLATSGAGGMQRGYESLGGLYENQGRGRANIITGAANQLNTSRKGEADSRAGIKLGQGGQAVDMHTNTANANSAANANLWGAIMGLTNAAVGMV